MKLGLGTVQFGMNYGISNKEGRTTLEETAEILRVAARNNIRVLDTAPLYGGSEQALGNIISERHAFSIVTKTPSYQRAPITAAHALQLKETFGRSLEHLRVSSLYGLLIHHPDDLLAPNGARLVRAMEELKQAGMVEKIGVSVYRGEQIDAVMERFALDLIQVPVNVLDQRLVRSGHLKRLRQSGVEVHARSVFLQGLLLMDPADLTAYFDPLREHLVRYHTSIRTRGLTPVQAALGFVAGLEDIDVVLCGVNNHRQLEDICRHWKPCNPDFFAPFAVSDDAMINPSRWRAA